MKSWSIVRRLTTAFAATTTVVFLAAGAAIFAFQTGELRRHQLAELQTRMDVVQNMTQHAERSARWGIFREKLQDFVPPDGSVRVLVESRDPRFTFGEPWPEDARITRRPDGSFEVRFDDQVYLGLEVVVPPLEDRPVSRVVVASDLRPMESTLLILGLGVLAVSLSAAIVLSLLAWLIARRGLEPLQRLSQHAAALNPQDLNLRLPQDALPRELQGLTIAFNDALDRLQSSYARLSTFNADVAHELRTPIGNLIGQTQVSLSRPRSTLEMEEVLQSNLEELERLRGIVNDMLFLARADEGALADTLVETSLAALVGKTVEFMEVLLEEASATLTVEGDARVLVEPALLGRAITNLLDNAVRHGPAGQTVRVEIVSEPDSVHLSVANPGAEIPPADLARMFDRFYRLDPARQDSGATHGLGLAIVKAVALMHGGEVFARCEDGQVRIGLSLPMAGPIASAK